MSTLELERTILRTATFQIQENSLNGDTSKGNTVTMSNLALLESACFMLSADKSIMKLIE